MALTRRELLERGALAAAAAGGVYELVDRLGTAPQRASAAATATGREQHLIDLKVVTEDGVEVLVPPLHHAVLTARVAVDERPAALREAQRELERALVGLERDYAPGPAGLSATVAWGLPYFRRCVPAQADAHLPVDVRATRDRRRPVRSLIDTRRFPSDPNDVVLEENDVAILLRGDRRDAVSDGLRRLLRLRGVLEPTSIRRGFVGGGLPRSLALAAKIPGADRIPAHAQLFLGFTSTQRRAMGHARIANLETLGYTARNDYFAGGTHLHLSHLDEDLERWYRDFTFRERVWTAFNPSLDVPAGTRTVKQDRGAVPATVVHQYRRTGVLGHSGAIQTTSRLTHDVVGPDGTVYRRGSAVPQRADFNTLDNPFAWSAHPARDRMRSHPTAGVHFVAFHPTSDDFHRARLAMDGILPDGTRLPFEPHDRAQGFNAVLRATHRQNFIVPPRRHRSLPLAEIA